MIQDERLRSVLEAASNVSQLRFDEGEVLRSDRSVVVRARNSGSAVSHIAKQFGTEWREHFLRERAGLRTLAALPCAHCCPRLRWDDDATLTLVLEDLHESIGLDHLFEARDADLAKAALQSMATQLGRIHGLAPASKPHDASLGVVSPRRVLEESLPACLRFLECALGVPAAQRAQAVLLELLLSVDRLNDNCTFTLGDLAPSNVLMLANEARFIDLEYCGVRHRAYDTVFWRWVCPMPAAVSVELDHAYALGLREAGVRVSDAELAREQLIFGAHRVFWTLSWNMDALFVSDREFVPGVSGRSILHRYLHEYSVFAEACGAEREPCARLLAELAERLAALWPLETRWFELPCFRE